MKTTLIDLVCDFREKQEEAKEFLDDLILKSVCIRDAARAVCSFAEDGTEDELYDAIEKLKEVLGEE